MRRLQLTCAALLGCAVLALLPTCALAASPAVRDCQAHNGLRGHYTDTQLQQALKSISPTIAEYSNCQQIIQDQLNTQLSQRLHGGGSGTGSSGGGSSVAVPIIVVVVVVLIVAGGGFLYWRRRTGGEGSDDPPPHRA
jgi:predicted PurR-regulated permease PerM